MRDGISFLYDLVLATLAGLIVFGAALGIVLGLLLVFAPDLAGRMQAVFNRRYSLRRALRPFEVSRFGERSFYRHHRVWGTLIVIGATIYLLTWITFEKAGLASLAPDPESLARWLIDSAEVFLTGGNIVALAVGLVIFFRPSLLKGLEERANTWVSTRRWARQWDQESSVAEGVSRQHPRVTGVLLILGGGFVLASFAVLWL